MYISDQFQQIVISVDQYCFISSLEKMTHSIFSFVDPASVTKGEVLNDFGKGDARHFNNHVNMVWHPTIPVDLMVESMNSFG